MRPRFTDTTRLKRAARATVEDGTDYLERHFERRYSRPAFSGRFEDRSVAEWQLEMLTDTWRQRTQIQQMIRVQRASGADNAQTRARMKTAYQHLRAIDDLFGDVARSNDAVDTWDEQFRKGQAPDLKTHISSLKMSARLRDILKKNDSSR